MISYEDNRYSSTAVISQQLGIPERGGASLLLFMYETSMEYRDHSELT